MFPGTLNQAWAFQSTSHVEPHREADPNTNSTNKRTAALCRGFQPPCNQQAQKLSGTQSPDGDPPTRSSSLGCPSTVLGLAAYCPVSQEACVVPGLPGLRHPTGLPQKAAWPTSGSSSLLPGVAQLCRPGLQGLGLLRLLRHQGAVWLPKQDSECPDSIHFRPRASSRVQILSEDLQPGT